MACDQRRHQLGIDQFANAFAGRAGVVGDDLEAGFALPDELVEHTFGRADAHEAADHEAGAVGDQRHRIC